MEETPCRETAAQALLLGEAPSTPARLSHHTTTPFESIDAFREYLASFTDEQFSAEVSRERTRRRLERHKREKDSTRIKALTASQQQKQDREKEGPKKRGRKPKAMLQKQPTMPQSENGIDASGCEPTNKRQKMDTVTDLEGLVAAAVPHEAHDQPSQSNRTRGSTIAAPTATEEAADPNINAKDTSPMVTEPTNVSDTGSEEDLSSPTTAGNVRQHPPQNSAYALTSTRTELEASSHDTSSNEPEKDPKAVEESRKQAPTKATTESTPTRRTTSFNAKWDAQFAQLEAFKNEHGHCAVPRTHPVGRWVCTQRLLLREFSEGKAPHANLDRIHRLERVGLGTAVNGPTRVVNSETIDKRWMAKYQELVAFKVAHGHVNVHKVREPGLYTWLDKQRQAIAGKPSSKGKMTHERMMKLVNLGVVFKRRETFEIRFKQLLDYKRIHGHTRVPVLYNALGKWCRGVRRSYHFSKLGKESKLLGPRFAQLESIGFDFAMRKKGRAGRTQDDPPSEERVNSHRRQVHLEGAPSQHESNNVAQLEEEHVDDGFEHFLLNEEVVEDPGESLTLLK